MEQYLVFCYETYYPSGGMDDCALQTNDKDEAFAFGLKRFDEGQHVHILDTKTGEIHPVVDREA